MPTETIERTPADVSRSVRNILADLRAHRIDAVVAAEIREAIEIEEQEVETERTPWVAVAALGLVLAILLAFWCLGILQSPRG